MDLLIRRDWRAPDEKFQFPKTEISPYYEESGARMMLLVVLLVNTVGVVCLSPLYQNCHQRPHRALVRTNPGQ